MEKTIHSDILTNWGDIHSDSVLKFVIYYYETVHIFYGTIIDAAEVFLLILL